MCSIVRQWTINLAVYCYSSYKLLKILIYFCRMNKLNLKRISEILTEKELKNVLGGSSDTCNDYCTSDSDCSGGECTKCSDISNWAGKRMCVH